MSVLFTGELPLIVIELICRMRIGGKQADFYDNGKLSLPHDLGALGSDITVLDLSNCSLTGIHAFEQSLRRIKAS